MQQLTQVSDYYGITFQNRHSWQDFKLRVIGKKVTFPAKSKVTIRPPYSNQLIDLSTFYNEQMFTDRTFEVTFLVLDRDNISKDALYIQWTKIVNWLMSPIGRQALFDDVMPEYYYLGEVVDAPTWDEFQIHGKFTVTWACYPFRIHRLLEGNDVWDTFNFDLDVAQPVKYDVDGSRNIVLLNNGATPIQPTIVTNAPLTLSTNGIVIQVKAGTTGPDELLLPLTLQVGVNSITINGKGHIEFQWHKEVI